MADEVKDDTTQVVNDDDKNASSDEDKAKASQDKDDDTKQTITDGDQITDEPSTDDDLDDDKVLESEDRVQVILDKYGYDSYEELEEDFGSLKELQELIGKRDAKQLIEDSEYLAKVKEYWEQQEEAKKREDESFEETIERLEKEQKKLEQQLKDKDKKEADRRAEKEAQVRAEKLIQSFNTTVTAEIDKMKDFPKEYKPFLREYLGVDNPANEIDIGLKPEVRSMAKEGIKKFQDLEQLIIKRYLEGKTETPKISSDTAQTPVDKEKKPKNLGEARKMLFDSFGIGQ